MEVCQFMRKLIIFDSQYHHQLLFQKQDHLFFLFFFAKMVKSWITILINFLLLTTLFCNASTLGHFRRSNNAKSLRNFDEQRLESRSISQGVQHWIFPGSRQASFSLNQFGLGIFNTLLGQGNPFAQQNSNANQTQPNNQRIADGVVNALGRE